VTALGVVELQRAGDGVQHALRDPAEVPALQAHVVVDADPGQHRDLLATQPGHPPVTAAVHGQPRLLGGDLRPPRGQELADLGAVVHVADGTSPARDVGSSAVTPVVTAAGFAGPAARRSSTP
jgi:hypothetical protein